MIDKQKLLAFLTEQAGMRSVVGGAIYTGLISRIQDGQFDNDTEGETP